MVSEGESVYDVARKTWAEMVTGVQATHASGNSDGMQEASSSGITGSSLRKHPLQGWALKVQKIGQRATENVKNFLLEKFNKGVKTGKLIKNCFPLFIFL